MSVADCLCEMEWLSERFCVLNYSLGLCWVTALTFVYLPVTYCIIMYNSAAKRCLMSKLFITGTLLTIRGRMFTDQVMETEDFDPSMPTIERYTTGRVWNHFDYSSQFPLTKCLHNADYSCANCKIFNGCKAQNWKLPRKILNSALENIEEKYHHWCQLQYFSIAFILMVTRTLTRLRSSRRTLAHPTHTVLHLQG